MGDIRMGWLDEIEKRAQAATPGAWGSKKDVGDRFYVHAPSYGIRDFCCLSGGFERREDAEFIAHAREDIPRLTAEVRRLSKKLEEARQSNKSKDNEIECLSGNLRVTASKNTLLKAELEAAKRDIEIALGTQRVCFACKNVIPCSNSITGEYGCDPKWRGLCAENGGRP